MDMEEIARSFAENKNLAFISGPVVLEEKDGPVSSENSLQAKIITRESSELKLLKYSFNQVKVKTNLDRKRFLFYTDNYQDEWQASIDGKKTPLYRTNVAFKGVWVPAGEHIVEFYYGSGIRYLRNYLMLILFYGVFVYLLILGRLHVRKV